MDSDRTQVIIVGAGFAGLAAADYLIERGVKVTIIDARNRLGGRAHTVEDDYGFPIELGAEFIHGKDPHIWDPIRATAMVAYDVTDEHWSIQMGKVLDSDAWYGDLRLIEHLPRLSPSEDVSFKKYLDDLKDASEEAKRVALRYVRGFDAANPEDASVSSLARENEAEEEIGGTGIYRFANGYEELVGYFARRLDINRMVLGTPIKSIRWKKGDVEALAVAADGSLSSFRGERAIITLPLGVLQAQPTQVGYVAFEPPLTRIQPSLAKMRMGQVVRVTLRFSESFWDEIEIDTDKGNKKSFEDFGFVHFHDPHFPTWWSLLPMRVPIVVGWSAGPNADGLIGKSAEFVREKALDAISSLMRTDRAEVESMLEDFHYHDWSIDPYSRGAYSYMAVGGAEAPGELQQPFEDTLFLAGEHTDNDGFSSTAHGAIRSGLRAAKQILQSLK